jgi:hypothetical protein
MVVFEQLQCSQRFGARCPFRRFRKLAGGLGMLVDRHDGIRGLCCS